MSPRAQAPADDLSVVIVTYASRPHIDACIGALRADGTAHEIVVVDNDSPDGTAAHVRANWPEVSVVETGANLGFGRACNRGLELTRGRHVLMLNPDTEVRPGALAELVDFLDRNPATGVVAPRLLNTDGSDQGTARRFPTPAAAILGRRSPLTRAWPGNRWSRRYLEGRAHDGTAPFEIDWVSGACLMAPRSVLDEIGGFDEAFFMHFEDADLCRRVKARGYRVWCVPSAEVVHHEGGSRRGWPAAQVRHFHHGAYRFYANHRLVGRRRFLRPLAAAAMGGRAAAVMLRERVRARAGRAAAAVMLGLAAVVVGLLGAGPAAAATADDPPQLPTVERLAGEDRYATAATSARAAFPDGVGTAVLARGDDLADALSGTYLAGQHRAPILLTQPDTLPDTTADALEDLDVRDVTLLGGERAITAEVADALSELGYRVTRIAGADRFETARLVALAGDEVGRAAGPEGLVRTALLMGGDAQADALAAGPLAYDGAHPILITTRDQLHPAAQRALTDDLLGIEQVLIVGGRAVVSQQVEDALGRRLTVERIAGSNRAATAAAVAARTQALRGWSSAEFTVASADRPTDALALTSLAVNRHAPVLLTSSSGVDRAVFHHLQDPCGVVQRITVAGGPETLPEALVRHLAVSSTCADRAFPVDHRLRPGRPGPPLSGEATLFLHHGCYSIDVLGATAGLTDASIVAASVDRLGTPLLQLAVPPVGGFVMSCLAPSVLTEESLQRTLAQVDARATHYRVELRAGENIAAAGQIAAEHEFGLHHEAVVAGPGDARASGTGKVYLGEDPDTLCVVIDVDGLSSPPSSIGFHVGGVDVDGPLAATLRPLDADGYSADCVDRARFSDLVGEDRLTPEQIVSAVTSGQRAFYVSVATRAHPDGALRGQVDATYQSELTGAAVPLPISGDTGGGHPAATGRVELYVGADDRLCYAVEAADLTTRVLGVAIHRGRAGETGAARIRLEHGSGGQWSVFGCVEDEDVTTASDQSPQAVIEEVLGDLPGHYVAVRTSAWPEGAIRGQLGPDWQALLDPSKVTAQATEGPLPSGVAQFFLNSHLDRICYRIHLDGLVAPRAQAVATLARGRVDQAGQRLATLSVLSPGLTEGCLRARDLTAPDGQTREQAFDLLVDEPEAHQLDIVTDGRAQLRSQLAPDHITLLSGDQVPDGGDLEAKATVAVFIGEDPAASCYELVQLGVRAPVRSATIDRGGPGPEAESILRLEPPGSDGVLTYRCFGPDDALGSARSVGDAVRSLHASPADHDARFRYDPWPDAGLRGGFA